MSNNTETPKLSEREQLLRQLDETEAQIARLTEELARRRQATKTADAAPVTETVDNELSAVETTQKSVTTPAPEEIAPEATPVAEPEEFAPIEETPTEVTDDSAETSDAEQPRRRKSAWVAIVCLIAVLALMCGAAYLAYRQYIYMKSVPHYYTLTDTTLPPSGLLHRQATPLPYGSELLMHEYGDTWTKVTMGKKWYLPCYVSTAMILDSGDFRRLDSIWGDDLSKSIITTARCRRALLNYFKENDLSTDWKVYSRDTAETTNTTFFQRVVTPDSKLLDFAVIIENKKDTARRCLLFSFDTKEHPCLVFDMPAPQNGYIRLVTNQEGVYTVLYDNDTVPATLLASTSATNPATSTVGSVEVDALRQNVKQDARSSDPDFQYITF